MAKADKVLALKQQRGMQEELARITDFLFTRAHLKVVVEQYDKSAPTVASWANDLYVRLGENLYDVRVVELLVAQSLYEEGRWEIPQYAANRVYKLMEELGQDTTGHAGY